MSNTLNPARIALLDGLITAINAGAGNGKLQLISNDSPPVVVADFTFQDPAFADATDTGAIIQALVTLASPNTTSTYSGSTTTIDGYRLRDGDGNLLCEDTSINAVGLPATSSDIFIAGLTADNGFTYELQGLRLAMQRIAA